jgi:hypothetical protein
MIRAAGLRRKADVGAWIGGWARSRPRLAVRVSHPAPRRLQRAPRRGTTPRTAGLDDRSFSNPIRASQLTAPICARLLLGSGVIARDWMARLKAGCDGGRRTG